MAKRNKDLAKVVLDQITKRPETYDQEVYHCRSAHCVAGHCQIMGGRYDFKETIDENIIRAYNDGKELLGLSEAQAESLFDSRADPKDVVKFLKAYIRGDRLPKVKKVKILDE